MSRTRRFVDLPRRIAYSVLRAVNGDGSYANLELSQQLTKAKLNRRDAGFVTELVSGTLRMQGSYDQVIAAASGRDISSLQPELLDILRLGTHQLLAMRVGVHAGVSTCVDLAGVEISEKVTGLVNAVVRKISKHSFEQWTAIISANANGNKALALKYGHPEWIVDAFSQALGKRNNELEQLVAADNKPAEPMLVVRPGLCEVSQLVKFGAKPAKFSPWGASRRGNPGDLNAVASSKAGVQDEGSQLVIQAATNVDLPDGPWLDMCAGPGGKAALLRGLCPSWLLAAERQPHRARLVSSALRAYSGRYQVITADATRQAWNDNSFSLVVADVPCSGLGALRRRPEARWRKNPADLEHLNVLQRRLLATALDSVMPGGVVAYITCSPQLSETVDVIRDLPDGFELLDAPSFIPQVPDAASSAEPRCIQLWPHRHNTDAMFAALIRKCS